MSKPSLLRRVVAALWNGVTLVRRALANILFLLLIVLIYFALRGGTPEPLPERAALLLNLTGTVVDEKSRLQPLQALAGEPTPADHEVLLRDVIESIEYAKLDPAISSLVMELDQLVYVGISKAQEIVRALESFRESGKPIVAVGDYYSQDQYLLASHADQVMQQYMANAQTIPPEVAADTLVWLATDHEPGKSTGEYFFERKAEAVSPHAEDDEAAAGLWQESEKMVSQFLDQ